MIRGWFWMAVVFLMAGAMALGYAYFIEPSRLVVTRQELQIQGWDPVFDGFRIVAIADIHGGSNGANAYQIRRVVETANAQDPDLIVLLGDYVAHGSGNMRQIKMPLNEIAANLAGLKARYGVFAVNGNHDDWYKGSEVDAALSSLGYTVLNSEVALIEKDGKRLRVIGLRDHLNIGIWKLYSDEAKRALAPTEREGNVLVLQHSPDIIPIITGEHLISDDMKLMLSGHTHGGQIWLPVLGRPVVPSSYGQKYGAGFIDDPLLPVFVTSGVGTSIMPFRFFVPPEIAVITIRSRQPG